VTTDYLADELRQILDDLAKATRGEDQSFAHQRLLRLAEHVERIGARPAEATTELVADCGMTADQQIRSEALAVAIRHLAATGELPDATQHQPRSVLGLADVYAAYIADGSRP
jgi:hypothetical protein